MTKVKIKYLLSEEGRKKSLLSGGNGKRIQEIDAELSERLLELANVDDCGDVWLTVGFRVGSYSDFKKIEDINYRHRVILCYTGAELDSPFTPSKVVKIAEEGLVDFDKIMSPEELITWEECRLARLSAQLDNLNETLLALEKECEAKKAELKAKRDADDAAKLAAQAEIIEKARIEACEREKKKRAEEEAISNWIESNGSKHLKKSISLGYNCKRLFVSEFVEKELPCYNFNFDDVHWNERYSPSEAAINEVSRLIDNGFDAVVGWVTYYDGDCDREVIIIDLYGYELYNFID